MPYFFGLIVGMAIGNISHVVSQSDNANKIRDTQIANEQVRDQLEQAHRVGQLVLDPEHKTFTFNSNAASGEPETCTGKYTEDNGTAHVTDDLSCTQTVPAPQAS